MQAGHDRADRTLERARDLAVAELLELGQFEDAALGGHELRQRGDEIGVVDGVRLGLARCRRGRERDDARS
jgi:hypothetical protein